MRAALLLVLLLCVSCGRTTSYGRPASCIRNPQQTPALEVQQVDGMTRAWNRERCVPVTYAPSLEKLKPKVQAALDAWDQVECTGLCFEAPTARQNPPTDDADYRLHVADTGAGTGGAWELLNDGRTAQTLHATIYAGTASTTGDLLKQLGYVLGFQAKKAAFRDTVLEEARAPNPRTGLGELDRQSVCALYPACR